MYVLPCLTGRLFMPLNSGWFPQREPILVELSSFNWIIVLLALLFLFGISLCKREQVSKEYSLYYMEVDLSYTEMLSIK